MVRVKPIWSSDNRANILTCLVDRPVYQALKRLVHILNVGLQQRRAVICSDGQREAFIQISITIYPVRHPRFAIFSVGCSEPAVTFGHFRTSTDWFSRKSIFVHKT